MQALINLTITTTVTALAVLLIKGLFSKKMSARWQYYIWLVLLVRILVPVLPQSPLSVFNFTPSVQQVSVEQVPVGQDSQTSAAPSQAGGIYQGQQSADKPAQEQAPQTSAPQTGTAPPAASQKPAEEKLYIEQVILKNQIQDTQTTVSFEVWVYRTIVWIWLGGACLLAGYFVLVYAVFCRRVKRDARAYGENTGLLQECKKKVGVKRRVHLRIYGNTPMLKGVFSPVILLPRRYEEPELEQVLIHELCHLRHHDVLIGFLATAILCIFWFNPVIWLCYSTFKKDTELLCDYHVVQAGGNKKLYAQVLLGTALEKNQFIPMTTSLQNGKKEIVKRIEHLAFFKRPKVIWSLVLLAAVGVFFLTNRASDQLPALSIIEGMQLPQSVAESAAYQRALQEADAVVYDDNAFNTKERILKKLEKLQQDEKQSICVYALNDDGYEVYRFEGQLQNMQQTRETYASLNDVGRAKAVDVYTEQDHYFVLSEYGYLGFAPDRTGPITAFPVIQLDEENAGEFYEMYKTYFKPVRRSFVAREFDWPHFMPEDMLDIAGDWHDGELWQTYGDIWPIEAVKQALAEQHMDTESLDFMHWLEYTVDENTVSFPKHNRKEAISVRITGYEQDGDNQKIYFLQIDEQTGSPIALYTLFLRQNGDNFWYMRNRLEQQFFKQGYELHEDGLYVYFAGRTRTKVPAENISQENYRKQWDVSVGENFAKMIVKGTDNRYMLYSTQDWGQTWQEYALRLSYPQAYASFDADQVLMAFADANEGYLILSQETQEGLHSMMTFATENGGKKFIITQTAQLQPGESLADLHYYKVDNGSQGEDIVPLWLLATQNSQSSNVTLYNDIWGPYYWFHSQDWDQQQLMDLGWKNAGLGLENREGAARAEVILPDFCDSTSRRPDVEVQIESESGIYAYRFYMEMDSRGRKWYYGGSDPIVVYGEKFEPVTTEISYDSTDEEVLQIAGRLFKQAEWLQSNWTAGKMGSEIVKQQGDTTYYLYDWIEKYKTPEDVYSDFDNTFVPAALEYSLGENFRSIYRMIDGQLYNAQWMSYNFSGLRYYVWDDMQVVEKSSEQIVVECTLVLPMAEESQQKYIRIVKIDGRWLIDDSYFADAVRPEMDEAEQAVFDKYLPMAGDIFSPFEGDFDEQHPFKIQNTYLLRNCLGYYILGDSGQMDEAMMNGQPLDASFVEDPILHYFPSVTREDIQNGVHQGDVYDPVTNTYTFNGGYGGGGPAPLFTLEYERQGDKLHITLREYESEMFWVLRSIQEFTIQDYDDGSFAYLSYKITSYNYWGYDPNAP